MRILQKRTQSNIILVVIASLVMAVLPQISGSALASSQQFATVAVRLDNILASNSLATPTPLVEYTGGTVCVAMPATAYTNEGNENYVDVGFPAEESGNGSTIGAANDFEVNTTTANWKTNTTNLGSANTGQNYWPLLGNSSATAWPTIGATAAGATNGTYSSGQVNTDKVVRFATGALAHGNTYCFNFLAGSNGVGAPGTQTSGTYSLQNPDIGLNGYQEYVPGFVATYDCTTSCTTPGNGTLIMRSNWGTQISPNNSIIVSAVVPPIFIMTFGANADAFVTNLDPNNPVETNGVNITVQTNAKGGWIVWTHDQNQALTSASSGGSIGTVGWNGDLATSLSCGGVGPACTPEYAMNAAVTSNVNGSGTTLCGPTNTPAGAEVEPEYAGSLANDYGGDLTANWSETADCSTTTPPGTDGGTTIKLTEIADINFSTPAASDYTDTIYVVGAGQF